MNKGFSLVELLISLAIVSLMMAFATISFNQYSEYWTRQLGEFEESHAKLKLFNQFSQTIEKSLPLMVKDKDDKWGGYFLGRDQGFTLVTQAPIFSSHTGYAVVRIFEESTLEGQLRLVYEEAPLNNELLRFSQPLDFRYRTVIARANLIKFEYLGWKSYQERFSGQLQSEIAPSWYNEIDAQESFIPPLAVSITINDKRFEWPIGYLLPEQLTTASLSE
jgi:prepilin-type N-terminal cleavage/methylation domain-containing protein